MDLEVGDLGGSVSPAAGKKNGKILVSPIIERIRARNGDEEGGR
jgi:hypothetical protein